METVIVLIDFPFPLKVTAAVWKIVKSSQIKFTDPRQKHRIVGTAAGKIEGGGKVAYRLNTWKEWVGGWVCWQHV